MANGFKLDSEQFPQSPQQQQLAAQQPTPAQGQGGNLLSFLGDLGVGLLRGIESAGASYAATQGRPQMLQQIQARQQQEQQQNLLGQLQTFAEQADPDVKELIQNQIKFGQPDAALKTAANASTFSTFKRGLETSRLSPDLKKTISNVYLTNPGKATDMLRSLEIVESQMGAARQKEQLQRERSESKTAIAIIKEGLKRGDIRSDDPNLATTITTYLQARDKKVSPELAKAMLIDPEITPYFSTAPANWGQTLMYNFFGVKPKLAPAPGKPPAQAPAQAPAQPQGFSIKRIE
jgi:hypothetical protein